MKKLLGLLILLTYCSFANAQVIESLTNVRDTSFATWSAFQKEKKHHPDIEIATVAPSKNVIEKKDIVYHTINKRKLLLDAFVPKQANSIAFIVIHGGGWRSGNRTQHYNLARALAARGYTCFTPEYRLSTEAYYPAGIFDIKEAIKWVRLHAKDYKVDTNKIVIAGFSAGGQMAALIGCTGDMPEFENYDTKNGISTKVNAIVDIDGVLSFVDSESSEMKGPDKIGASALWFGYTLKENPVLFTSASALSYANYSPPVLFLNSSVKRMHAGREDYIKILNSKKVYSEVHEFENSPHPFCLFNPWFEPTVKYIDDFLQKIFKLNQ